MADYRPCSAIDEPSLTMYDRSDPDLNCKIIFRTANTSKGPVNHPNKIGHVIVCKFRHFLPKTWFPFVDRRRIFAWDDTGLVSVMASDYGFGQTTSTTGTFQITTVLNTPFTHLFKV